MPIEPLVLLAGRLTARDAASVSPFDRGFLFGDGLYEGVKLRDGVPLFLARHLSRLARGLAAARLSVDLAGLERDLRGLVAANGTRDGFLYLQITRGVAGERRHLPPPGLAPTVFAFLERRGFPAPASAPQRAVSSADFRWRRTDLKTTSLLATTLGKLAAADAEADEVIWTGARGRLLEGGNTNVFARGPRGLETAPDGPRLLPGVTRDLVIAAAHRLGLPVRRRAPRLSERDGWRELFVTGTVTGVQALVELDGTPVGDGQVGAWTRLLAAELDAAEAIAVQAEAPR